MTTGATGQLGLALPVQGELSGTWGDTVNNGITQYTNIAIAGTLTLTGDGAVTLANTTGDASASNITSSLSGAGTVTAQFAIVKVSGTTTTKVVTGPSYSKTYVVDNASSFAVTFKASGQTGVSIAAAEKVTVVFNGTDYIKLAGTIANAAGSNTQIQFNNGGLFGASANLTWDGTTLSSTQVNITGQGTLRLQDTTGGEYVGLRSPGTLSASYTLTFPADDGTSGQALITDGSGVLSWSTAASGDVYGPASATDNALARFDGTTGKLIQDSVVIVGDTGAVTGVTDLTASGSVTLSGGTANGVAYLNGSKVVTSGSALTFDGTLLTVASSTPKIRLSDSGLANDFGIDFYFPSVPSSYGQVTLNGSTGGMRFVAGKSGSSGYYQAFELNGSEQMRLTSSGLSVGTATALASATGRGNITINGSTDALLAFGNAAALGGYILRNTSGITYFSDGDTYQRFFINSSEVGRFTSTGLGIGTSSPAQKLSVASGATSQTAFFSSTSTTAYGATDYNGAGARLTLVGGNASGATTGINFTQGGSFEAYFGGVQEAGGAAAFVWQGYSGSAYAERMRLDSAGNLGIGTSSPSDKLQVAGTIRFGANATYYGTLAHDATTTGANIYNSQDAGGHLFQNSGSTVLTLNNSGNLGLGVTPSAWLSTYRSMQIGLTSAITGLTNDTKLFLNNNAYFNASSQWVYAATSPATQYQLNDGQHRWYNAPSGTAGNAITFTQAMTLTAAGNLALGTTSANGRATIVGDAIDIRSNAGAYGTGYAAEIATNANVPRYNLVDNSSYTGQFKSSSGVVTLSNQSNNALTFETNATERARIDSSGNLLVGTTTAQTGVVGDAVGITLYGSSANGVGVFVRNSSLPVLYINNKTSGGALIQFYNGGNIVGDITSNGTTTSYNTSSDYRLKNTIAPMTGALAKVALLKPCTYKWNADGSDGQGFIAHELAEVVPQCVTGEKDAVDEEGNPKYQGIDTSFLVATLTAAIQELKAEFDAYKASHP